MKQNAVFNILLVFFLALVIALMSAGILTLMSALHIIKTSYTITDVLLLSILAGVTSLIVICTRIIDYSLLKEIFLSQSQQIWEYRLYQARKTPSDIEPMISITNALDLSELNQLGYSDIYKGYPTPSIKSIQLGKGLSRLNQIGWELVSIQENSDSTFSCVFRRPRRKNSIESY